MTLFGELKSGGGSAATGEPRRHKRQAAVAGSSYLKASLAGPVVVTRDGDAVAVLLGVSDDEELERLLLGHSRKLGAILDAADRRIEEGAGMEHDEFWEQVESESRGREKNGSRKKR